MNNSDHRLYSAIHSHNTLSILGGMFLVLGLFGTVGLAILAGVVNNDSDFQSWGASGIDPFLAIAAAACLFQSVLMYALLRGLSDIIRLLMAIGRQGGTPAPHDQASQ